jgi:hypothetical protein
VLSLPPAFVLSQDQTLKFNVLFHPLLRRREKRDPVTNYSPILLSEPMRSSSELATAETFALLKAQTSAAAGVSLSKQTMHRAHDPEVETFGELGTVWVAKPFAAITRDVFGTPRSPWEPRLYGGRFWVSNPKLQNVYGELGEPQKPVEPIVLLCPVRLSGINI